MQDACNANKQSMVYISVFYTSVGGASKHLHHAL